MAKRKTMKEREAADKVAVEMALLDAKKDAAEGRGLY